MEHWRIVQADCREVMRQLPPNSVSAIVTDPPYNLGFMNKGWDATGVAFRRTTWARAYAALKPGGYLLAFGGTRTYHRLACAIEDSGFIVRDCLYWMYGQGFPKSLDVSKAIDDTLGMARDVVSVRAAAVGFDPAAQGGGGWQAGIVRETAPASDLARQWDGYGTALKPACEPIVLAQKPLDGTYAENVMKWGVGALNIAGTRIEFAGDGDRAESEGKNQHSRYANPGSNRDGYSGSMPPRTNYGGESGRWPANVLLDEEAAALLDAQSGERKTGNATKGSKDTLGDVYVKSSAVWARSLVGYAGETGGASRFFYVAKASRAERDYGCDDLPMAPLARSNAAQAQLARGEAESGYDGGYNEITRARNLHPTVKPVALMRHLVRLVVPPGALVLDPFAGSGTTGMAALQEGARFLGIEESAEYAEIARRRIAAVAAERGLS